MYSPTSFQHLPPPLHAKQFYHTWLHDHNIMWLAITASDVHIHTYSYSYVLWIHFLHIHIAKILIMIFRYSKLSWLIRYNLECGDCAVIMMCVKNYEFKKWSKDQSPQWNIKKQELQMHILIPTLAEIQSNTK